MPNSREKLIELIHEGAQLCSKVSCRSCEHFTELEKCKANMVADHLISNGVTVQKWIPLTEQKPDRDTLVIVFFEGMRDTPAEIQIMYGWCIGGSATHWMPLPEPPKENDNG